MAGVCGIGYPPPDSREAEKQGSGPAAGFPLSPILFNLDLHPLAQYRAHSGQASHLMPTGNTDMLRGTVYEYPENLSFQIQSR